MDARSGRSISPHPWRDNEQAWKEHVYRSMRAVEGSLGHSLQWWYKEVGGSIAGVNRSVAAEMRDDESRVGDWVCREGGCVLTGDRGSQSLGCLADGQREGGVFLYFSEVCHGIAAPSWDRESCDPRFGGMGHGAASTDSRLPVIAFLPSGFSCRKLPFN